MIGDDGTNAPPAHALANRGMVDNVRGYTLYGDYTGTESARKDHRRRCEKGGRRRDSLGAARGLLRAEQENAALDITPVTPEIDLPYLPFVYDISVGVRRGEDDLKNADRRDPAAQTTATIEQDS